MTLAELLPELHRLSRADKLRLIQLLAFDIAREEGIEVAAKDKPYPIWSPYDAFEGAAILESSWELSGNNKLSECR